MQLFAAKGGSLILYVHLHVHADVYTRTNIDDTI